MKLSMLTTWVVGLLFAGTTYADYQSDVGVELLWGSIDGRSSTYVPPTDYVPPDPGMEPPAGGTPEVPMTPPASGIDDDYMGWVVGGTYYFAPVDTGNGPLHLADFIDRASGVSGQFGRLETDDTDLETEFWQADVRVVFATNWVLEAGLGGTDEEALSSDTEVDLYRAALGYYAGYTTEIKLGLDREDAGFEEYDRFSAQITHVQDFENGMTWHARLLAATVMGDHDIFNDVDGHEVEVDVSLYFNPKFGVGLNWAQLDRGDAGDVDNHKLWANYFVSEKVSLELSYFSEDHDGRDIESDGVLFKAKYRI